MHLRFTTDFIKIYNYVQTMEGNNIGTKRSVKNI